MELLEIELENFKKIKKARVEVGGISVLVGGNDSGKSSFVQGVHFGVMAAGAFHDAGKKTFPQERLLFCPTLPFFRLSNKGEYANQSNFFYCRFGFSDDAGTPVDQKIRIYRAKNDNVGFEYEKSVASITRLLSKKSELFSVYVPGVSGVSRSEPLHQKGHIKRGIASGDANLYLRSVIYHIKKAGRLDQLVKHVKSVFPNFYLACEFDEENDTEINVLLSTSVGGIPTVPMELSATGVLQVLQLFAYVTLFAPRLLLLDEPDSHIHPDRQISLAKSLIRLTEKTNIKIVLATHSKHLISALTDHARFYSLKDGVSYELKEESSWVSLATDLGIASGLESLNCGAVDYLVLTEDSDKGFIKRLLVSNGFDLKRVLISSYDSCSQFTSAILLAQWVSERFKKTQIIIHRDRDFMTNEEVNFVMNKQNKSSFKLFITEGSDIESYFCEPEVISEISGISLDKSTDIVNKAATVLHNELVAKFTTKRQEATAFIKRLVKEGDARPNSLEMSSSIPLPKSHRLGKAMIKEIRKELVSATGKNSRFSGDKALKSLERNDVSSLKNKGGSPSFLSPAKQV